MPVQHGFDPVLAAEQASEESGEGGSAGTRRRKLSQPLSLSSDQLRRQGDVTSAAFVALGQARAIAFLNGHQDALGGRPLDIAIESATGLAAVKDLIKAETQHRAG